MRKGTIIINSAVAFTAAAVFETILHEAGHFVTARALGVPSVLYHNYVSHSDSATSLEQRIVIAAAGPVLSLLIGIVLQAVLSRLSASNTTRLFVLYTAAFGYIGFLGYMMVAPFFSYGDTGYVLRALGVPMWGILVFSAASVAALYLVMKRLAREFVSFMSRETAADKAARGSFVAALVLWPFFIGTAAFTLLNLPVPTPLSLIAPLCSPFSLLWVYGEYINGQYPNMIYDRQEQIGERIAPEWIVALALLIVANRLLVAGFGG